ncbi:MAG: Fic family protein [Acidobacteriaceae bacterium]
MATQNQLPNNDRVGTFQEKTVPAEARLAGWAWLVQSFGVRAPVRRPSVVSDQHVKASSREAGDWTIYDKRYWPGEGFGDHLGFALRNENLDLLVLKRIFDVVPQDTVTAFVRSAPTGAHNRRAWFLYEFMTGRTLDIEDAPEVSFTDLLDSRAYFTTAPVPSRRHKVRDNLLGNRDFCPIVRKTQKLTDFGARALGTKANEIIGHTGANVVARAASFLLLADSRASFEIEGEKPPRGRLERWGRAVAQAGKNKLTLDEIVRLHMVLIEDTRFTRAGLRLDGVFLGERDHEGDPLPEFIGARPEDLQALMQGLIAANERMRKGDLDTVLQAAATAFGFVYIHPFQDGNGRMHRCLIHHVLAERKFTPPGMVFPVSPVMLDRIETYRDTLRAHSGPLMDYTDWRPTPERNVEVQNDTADLYRYFDCTAAAEFLYGCVERAINEDLPREIDFLRRNDEAMRRVMNTVEMPDRIAENLIRYIRLNEGRLGRKRREGEFEKLTDDEVASIEAIVREAFEGFETG